MYEMSSGMIQERSLCKPMGVDAARELVGELMLLCRMEMVEEEGARSPDMSRLSQLDDEMRVLDRKRRALSGDDNEGIAAILRDYPGRLRMRRAALGQRLRPR